MEEKRFQKKIEDFACLNCQAIVHGSGFTNHCPKCLYSRHVDVNPGDRKETCMGMMEPVAVENDHGSYVIVHKCLKCKAVKKNQSNKDDNYELIVKLAALI
ncbi:MAG: RNHCP domain-containing protein [Acidobacteriaceae bacterium]